jgi:sortase A
MAVGSAPFVFDLDVRGDDSLRSADADTTTTSQPEVNELPGSIFSPPEVAAVEPSQVATSSTTTSSTSTSTTTTVAAVTTTVPRQQTEPIPPPSDPRGFEERVELGGISIPKLGLDAPLLSGIRLTTLDIAPGHWPGSALPGEVGNVVVAAHRTSHNAEFRNIDQLVEGDVVLFGTDDGDLEYTVVETLIVNPDAIWIVDPSDNATATLFACHPPGSVAQRIVVKLELSA